MPERDAQSGPTQPDAAQPESITGIEAMRGAGVVDSRGFWLEAWGRVVRRPGAIIAIAWIAIVAAAACFAPVLANGHPILMREIDIAGNAVRTSSPLLEHLTSTDALLLLLGVLGPVWMLAPRLPMPRTQRLGALIAAAAQAGLSLGLARLVRGLTKRPDVSDAVRELEQQASFPLWVALACAAAGVLIGLAVPSIKRRVPRAAVVLGVGAASAFIAHATWNPPPSAYTYLQREAAGEITAVYAPVPWSPAQRFGDRDTKELPPGATSARGLLNNLTIELPPGELTAAGLDTLASAVERAPLSTMQRAELLAAVESLAEPRDRASVIAALATELDTMERRFPLGTDAAGQDVLAQLIHASRLSLSIGFVATGIAVLIGVTLGAIMGYFGGVVDLLLYRLVEIFMSVPVLVVLIVASAILPRNTYVMMAVIGCFTWHGAARFTRAEFMKLRSQDFVQAARAAGLGLRSILFRHMLPNGVTPVLVDASFGIAIAILFEAVISFLGYGPADQSSWGRLLADATGETTEIHWWLATFPGAAIFMTVLAYNMLGEALRDAIDPKLRKARA